MKLITVATHSEGYFPILIQSCNRFHAKIDVLGWGKKWGGFTQRWIWIKEYLDKFPDDEIVCFVDAFDVVLLRPLEDIEAIFRSMNTEILISVEYERKAFGNLLRWINFGKCQKSFINAGTYIGYVRSLKIFINDICNTFDCNDKTLDDQVILTSYCQKNNNIKLDTQRQIFLVSIKEQDIFILEKIHKLDPCVLHGACNNNLDSVLTQLGYTVEVREKRPMYFWHYFRHFCLKITLIILCILAILYIIYVGVVKIKRIIYYKSY